MDVPDFPLRGVYPMNEVYEGVTGWDSFEPWLSNVERLEEKTVWEAANNIPPDWYCGRNQDLEQLVSALLL